MMTLANVDQRQRPVTNVAVVFVVLLTSLPIMVAARLTRQVSEET